MYESILSEYRGDFGQGRSLDKVVDWVEALPPMPRAASRALKLVEDPDASGRDFAEVLSADPALASSILRTANSASLGYSQAVERLDDAVLVIGLARLRSILLAVTLRDWNKTFGAVERLVWEKSLGTAAAADVIATHLGKKYRDEIRLIGLLHNLGQIVLLSHEQLGRDYLRVLTVIREQHLDYASAERQVIGFSHPLVGAMVARKWGLPVQVCMTILRYAEPFEGISNRLEEHTAVIKLASELCLSAEIGRTEGHPPAGPSLTTVAVALGFKPQTFETDLSVLIRQTKAQFQVEASAYA